MIIDENNVGIRIDKYLTDNTEYTRSKIQKMIDNGNILVNGKEVDGEFIKNDYVPKVYEEIKSKGIDNLKDIFE